MNPTHPQPLPTKPLRLIIFAFLLAVSSTLFAADGSGTLKIVCVGDSITNGDKIERGKENYPKALERLLAGKATVLNAGQNGAGVIKADDVSYWTTKGFTAAMNAAPQVVVIMLGSNDSRVVNWSAHKADYSRDLGELVTTFAKLPSKPAVWLCLPPPMYSKRYNVQPQVLEKEIIPQIRQVAKANNCGVIDVFTALSNHPELFADGVHPNTNGAALIARTVSDAIATRKDN